MAARIPRRSFATPFVVTFTAACSTSAPPPATQPPANELPPEPVATAPNPGPSAGPTNPESVQPTPPETTTPVPTTNPPPPPPPPENRSWMVMKHGTKCDAMPKMDCPHGKPGEPMPTCNPPPARDYACPPGITAESPMTIVARGNICVIQAAMPSCPPHMHCNPPPQRSVPCPE